MGHIADSTFFTWFCLVSLNDILQILIKVKNLHSPRSSVCFKICAIMKIMKHVQHMKWVTLFPLKVDWFSGLFWLMLICKNEHEKPSFSWMNWVPDVKYFYRPKIFPSQLIQKLSISDHVELCSFQHLDLHHLIRPKFKLQ